MEIVSRVQSADRMASKYSFTIRANTPKLRTKDSLSAPDLKRSPAWNPFMDTTHLKWSFYLWMIEVVTTTMTEFSNSMATTQFPIAILSVLLERCWLSVLAGLSFTMVRYIMLGSYCTTKLQHAWSLIWCFAYFYEWLGYRVRAAASSDPICSLESYVCLSQVIGKN